MHLVRTPDPRHPLPPIDRHRAAAVSPVPLPEGGPVMRRELVEAALQELEYRVLRTLARPLLRMARGLW